MDSQNRISQTSVTPTVERQTPKNEFGAVMARTAGVVMRHGSAVVGGFLTGGPVASAAVSSMSNMLTASASPASTAGAVVPLPHGAEVGARAEGFELLEAQAALQANGQRFNVQFLELQEAMQKESRQFTTLSNVLKVRHDSAKAAINNIR